ncbi:MAG TPA: hypothetical protein VFV34_04730, partial [Blastocatellia bacterium]|nr:hypothetical protein [Blastocatellia bacterium]
MELGHRSITRRNFLIGALAPLVSGAGYSHATARRRGSQLAKSDLDRFKQQILSLVNAERGAIRASSLMLDDLACSVAEQH